MITLGFFQKCRSGVTFKNVNLDTPPPNLTPYEKINCNYIGNQNVKIMKIQEVIIGACFHYLGEHKVLLKVTEINNHNKKKQKIGSN